MIHEPGRPPRLSAEETGWFHGGIPGLRPGQLLRPRRELPAWQTLNYPARIPPSDITGTAHGAASTANSSSSTSSITHATVAITTDPWAALAFAGDERRPWPAMDKTLRSAGDLYRVEPLCNPHTCPACMEEQPRRGDVGAHLLPDPDFPDQPDRFARVHHAVVLDVVQERVALDERDFVRLLAPYQSWAPNDPVYDVEGFLRPSPSMRAAGCTAAELTRFGHWVPLSEIDHNGVPMGWTRGWGRAEEMRRQTAPWREALQLSGRPLGRFAAAGSTGSSSLGSVPPKTSPIPKHREETNPPSRRGITRRWRRRRSGPPQPAATG